MEFFYFKINFVNNLMECDNLFDIDIMIKLYINDKKITRVKTLE